MRARGVILGGVATLIMVLVLAACGGGDEETPAAPTSTPPSAPATEVTPLATPVIAVPTTDRLGRVVEVINRDPGGGSDTYRFDPKDMTFKIGETITFRTLAQSEFHTFNVDELGIDVELNAEESKDVTVTMKVAGTFRLYCLVHEAKGMVGTITVE